MCSKESDFYTAAGYRSKNHHSLTESMEDYLEMICRHCKISSYVRVNFLAMQLHVRPSSVSKMALQLKNRPGANAPGRPRSYGNGGCSTHRTARC